MRLKSLLLLSCIGCLSVVGGHAEAGETILHSFAGGSDGAFPTAYPAIASGTLYGVTPGNSSIAGTAFSLTTGGTESVLAHFSNSTGTLPAAALMHAGGLYYGTTTAGGAYGGGTVFSMTPAGAIKVLHSFGSGTDGSSPAAVLVMLNGVLYGTTAYGGANGKGIVFSLTTGTSVKETVMHAFGAIGDGATPQGGLVYTNSRLWGTTEFGGTFNGIGCITKGCGTVYSISTSGAYQMVHALQGSSVFDGQWPSGRLTPVSGVLYGTTQAGGANSWGTVFSVTTGGTESVIHSFNASVDGGSPMAGVIYAHGLLYGTASYGGPYGNGTLFSMSTAGVTKVVYGFGAVANDGNGPASSLSYTTSGSTYTFYGTTSSGGAYNFGTLYSIQ
jgi:uncharacterized repeat protein (TIGR03803 family)